MDVVGFQRQGRRLLDQLGVERVAALHLAEADAVTGHGEIFVAQEIAHPLVRGVDLARFRFVSRRQARLIGFGKVVGEVLDRTHELGFGERHGQQGIELFDHAADGQLRFQHAAFHPFARALDRAVADGDVIVVAAEIIFVIREGLELRSTIAAGEVRIKGVEAAEMIDRPHLGQRADFVGLAAQSRFLLILENIVGKLVGRRELAAVDLVEQREIELSVEPRSIEAGVGQVIAEPVGVRVVATEQPT